MYAVATAFAAIGATLLLRLRGELTPPAAYAHRIAGVMASAFALMLAGFATAAWRAG
jgi:hypothetical protein